jgi:hypothetical protein
MSFSVLLKVLCFSLIPLSFLLFDTLNRVRQTIENPDDIPPYSHIFYSIGFSAMFVAARLFGERALKPLGYIVLSAETREHPDRLGRFSTVAVKFMYVHFYERSPHLP